MNYKKIVTIILIVLSLNTLVGCSINNENNQNNSNKATKQDKQETDNNMKSSVSTMVDTNNEEAIDKIEERREEFIGRLDCIQKQLDTLPIKKDSDKGITNAMRSYYGESYEQYDTALNEIYDLLKDQLSKETMKSLQTEETNWITQKENRAKKSENYKVLVAS